MTFLPPDMARQVVAARQAEIRRAVTSGRRHRHPSRRHPAVLRRAGLALIAAGRLLAGPETVPGEPLWGGSRS